MPRRDSTTLSRRHFAAMAATLALGGVTPSRNDGASLGEAVMGSRPRAEAQGVSQPAVPVQDLEFESIGSPADYRGSLSHQYLADLQLWHDRIYIGHGDWGVNTGPAQAMYLDLASGQFVHDDGFSFDEEAIESFVVLDDVLYAIGADAIASEGWAFGSLYRKWWGGAWEKLQTVPGGVHLFGLGQLAGSLVASGSDDMANGVIWQSWDGGWAWQIVASIENPTPGSMEPLFVRTNVLTLNDRLFVPTPQGSCFAFDGVSWSTLGCVSPLLYGVSKSLQFGANAVMAPSLPRTHTPGSQWAKELVFFDGQEHWPIDLGIAVRDIDSDGDSLYVLAEHRAGDGRGVILATGDSSCRCAEAFVEIAVLPVQFEKPRSLTHAGNHFYVGLGGGELLRSSSYAA